MTDYNPAMIEQKWQAYWAEHKTFRTEDDFSKPKYYILDMFPYPSGSGLHVGHPEGYTATDILARYKRMKGFNVLHPMGWDAFGLPAERAAMRENAHPAELTKRFIDNFRAQIQRLGFSYDWDREINTTDPKYYKWTQWIFLQLYKKGLAYQANVAVNWCPAQGTVLANEEVSNGKYVETGDPVFRKNLRQWQLKIPVYAERLLADLELVDWPESIKEMQRNWIGRSEGAEVDFQVDNHAEKTIRVYTTRPDTLFGATYMVLAPEHELVSLITTEEHRKAVEAYILAASRKSDLERTDLAKDKTGVFTGKYAINPVNGHKIPIWVADYVLISYGTGAIMSVPGHDSRDWEFATKFNLPIVEVISGGNVQKEAFVGDGILVNSGILNGLAVKEAKEKISAWLAEKGLGEATVNYRLRDWLFSRQRYWGEPFPLVHLEDGSVELIEELPVTLPHVDAYKPTEDGQPPLARAKEWIHTTSKAGKPALRETNTMPQWAGSCWYYLRYIDPHNDELAVDPEKEKYWMPVDLYVGGAEHAVLHLLYARFWHKVLYDAGVVSTKEPFKRLFNQGMIQAFSYKDENKKYHKPSDVESRENQFFVKNSETEVFQQLEKMGKSKLNSVNPDDIVEMFGADTMRLYEMYMGPLEQAKRWQTDGTRGMFRFLGRVFRLFLDGEVKDGNIGLNKKIVESASSKTILKKMHATIKKVGEEIEGMRFNTGISALIELINALYKEKTVSRTIVSQFTLLLAPFAPHLAEEIWRALGNEKSLAYEPWPTFNEALLVDDTITIAIQVNGKMRGIIEIAKDTNRNQVLAAAKNVERVIAHIKGKRIIKEIYVPGRIVNIIAK